MGMRSLSALTENISSTPLIDSVTEPFMFPKLTAAQIERIAAHGVLRPITRGEVLIESGQYNVPFFIVKAGEIEVIRPSALDSLLIAIVRRDQFTGDISMILGRPAQMRLRVRVSGEVVELTRDQMHALIQSDAEMSEVLMTAFLARRIAMGERGIGDVLFIGSGQSTATYRIKEFLTRNGHPVKYLNIDRDADVQDLLNRFGIDGGELPVLICRGGVVLKNPDNQEIAECLGFYERIDHAQQRDVAIVGAGP